MASLTEHRIFHIPELFELILHELPTKDLLFSQAVSKTWRDFIANSTKLQKALFLIPDGDERLTAEEIVKSDMPVAIKGNPLLDHILEALEPGDVAFDTSGLVTLPCISTRPGNWEAMLLSQPPISELKILTLWSDRKGKNCMFTEEQTLQNSNGIRMKHVLQVLEEHFKESNKRENSDNVMVTCFLSNVRKVPKEGPPFLADVLQIRSRRQISRPTTRMEVMMSEWTCCKISEVACFGKQRARGVAFANPP